jgi:hypothetical protein
VDPEVENPRFFPAPKYSFVVQFCWQEKLLAERLRARQEALMNEQQAETVPSGEQDTGEEETELPPTTQPGD